MFIEKDIEVVEKSLSFAEKIGFLDERFFGSLLSKRAKHYEEEAEAMTAALYI